MIPNLRMMIFLGKFHYEVKFNLLINGAVVGSVSVDASSVNSYSAAEFGATVIQHEIVIKPVSYSMPKLDSKDVPYEVILILMRLIFLLVNLSIWCAVKY